MACDRHVAGGCVGHRRSSDRVSSGLLDQPPEDRRGAAGNTRDKPVRHRIHRRNPGRGDSCRDRLLRQKTSSASLPLGSVESLTPNARTNRHYQFAWWVIGATGIVKLVGCLVAARKGHRYPPEIIAHCVWLYHRFPLSFRESRRPGVYVPLDPMPLTLALTQVKAVLGRIVL